MTCLSQELVASIARVLNESRVPCILWGHYLLNVHGVPSIVASIDFVVPDNCLVHGAEGLSKTQRPTGCTDAKCTASSQERYTPPPTFHKHVDASEITVGLYPQSETLWFLPSLDDSFLMSGKDKLPPQYILASDPELPPWRPGRGAGLFKHGLYPVVVLKSHILLEAFLRLYARNAGKRIGGFGMAMIAYMEQYVEDDGLLDANQLPEPIRGFYTELHDENMTSLCANGLES